MLFDVQAALAEILSGDIATPATFATPAPEIAPVSQVSRVSQSQPAQIAAPAKVLPFAPPSAPEVHRPDDDPFRHGRSFTGDPRTWTGRIVSLDAWRRLSAWEKHGPDGRLWCGCCRAWVEVATALGHARAIRAEWLAREGRTDDG